MVGTIFAVLEVGLRLWESKERRKYLDELMKLKKDYYEEYNKARPDHALLDVIEWRLRTICKSFGSEAAIKDTVDK